MLSAIKAQGIYDDTVIVLMGDHGAWVPAKVTNQSPYADALTVGMATPFLAVKPLAAGGGIVVSDRPTSVLDIADSIADMIGLDASFGGTRISDDVLAENHVRRHFTYVFGNNPDAPGYFFPIHERIVKGTPFDGSSWSAGRKFMPQPDQ